MLSAKDPVTDSRMSLRARKGKDQCAVSAQPSPAPSILPESSEGILQQVLWEQLWEAP